MHKINDFAQSIRACLQEHFRTAAISYRGSFANGSFDELSDVDLEAQVEQALDNEFYAALEECLIHRFGPALVRYDPDFATVTRSQNVRFSFYQLPIFWRVDLTVSSCTDAGSKYPLPFPQWQQGTSALMNIIWAIKYHRRGNESAATEYLAYAREKVGLVGGEYSTPEVLAILDSLKQRNDIDHTLLAETKAVLETIR